MSFSRTAARAALPLGSCLLLYAFLGFFAGAVRISALGQLDLTPRILKVVAGGGAAVLLSAAWWQAGRSVWQLSAKWLGLAALAALILLTASEYSSQSFIFFQGPFLAADVLAAGALILAAVLLLGVRSQVLNVESGLILVQVLCAFSLINYWDSRLIFADDHPSFLYRFQLLREHFPFIPFYNTDWNGGYSGREFFPSGMLNVFLFFWPVVYFTADFGSSVGMNAYNFVLLLFIFIIPWANYAAARLFGCSRLAAVCAGALCLGPSLSYFEWLLRYGTLGFVFSAGMSPLALALAYRLSLSEQRPRLIHLLALLVFSFCAISWSLSALVFMPITLAALAKWRTTFGADRRKLVLAFVILFAAINGPWMKVFIRESKVFSFVSGQTMPGSDTRSVSGASVTANSAGAETEAFVPLLKKKYKAFKQELRKVNPVILFMFIPGIAMLLGGSPGLLLLATVLWLLFVAIVGDALKPQLELRRMIIPASYLMAIAAGVGIKKALLWMLDGLRDAEAGRTRRFSSAVGAVMMAGLLILSPLTAAAHFTNKRETFYRFAPDYFVELAEAIKRHGGDGRTLFFGFILHDFGASSWAAQDGGHIAPLAQLSGKEMYASDYYHSRWSTVDPIPASFRKRGSEGIEEFLDLVNVSAVVTFKREWLEYCRKHQDVYTEVYRGGRFRLFTRARRPELSGDAGYFYRGGGHVRRLSDGFAVRPEGAEVVVKYRFHPMLTAYPKGSAELFAVPAFIEDRGGGKQEQVSYVGVRRLGVEPEAEIRVGFYDHGGK